MNEQLLLPPFNIEAEQSVLGALMNWSDTYDEIAGNIRPGDFYRRDHGIIFTAIEKLADANQPYDLITVSEHLRKENELDNIGGLQYLGTLTNNTPTSANIKAYAGIN